MTDTNKIDLSLVANQNKIAVSIAAFFEPEETEQISVDELSCILSQDAVAPCGCMEYSKEFDNGKAFQVHCIIDTSCFPNEHYTNIRLKKDATSQSDFKCNPNANNATYIDLILKKAINYDKFKSKDDLLYNQHHIVKNFTNTMIKKVGDKEQFYVKIMQYIGALALIHNSDMDKYLTRKDFALHTEFEGIKVTFTAVDTATFKLTYFNTETGEGDYCFFLRSRVGVNMAICIFERCLNKIRISKLESMADGDNIDIFDFIETMR